MITPTIDEARVAEKAYEFWLADGQPDGKSDEHWFRAIDALTAPVPKKPRKTAAAKATPADDKVAVDAVKKPARARTPKAKA